MGLSKTLVTVIAISLPLVSCSYHSNNSMSQSDQALLEKSLKTHAEKGNSHPSDYNLSFYNALPNNLQDALAAYQQALAFGGMHDYDYLQELGVRFLRASIPDFNPEHQLLSVYGASIAKNEKLVPLLGEAILSPYPQVQLAALRALSEYQDDEASKHLIQGLNSNYLEVCFETLFILATRKHPETMGYIQSLKNKVPEQLNVLFPLLYALLDTPQSNKALEKLMQHPDTQVRMESILSAARYNRHDLLKTVRILSKQHDIRLQEACAFALGQFQDESSVDQLKEYCKSSCDSVALSASFALYRLGRHERIEDIEKIALQGNIFAISLLKDCPSDQKVLEALCHHSSDQVRLNAALALLKKKNLNCLPEIYALLSPKDPRKILSTSFSAGKAIQAKKWMHLSAKLLKENPYIQECATQYRQEVLLECAQLPEDVFLSIVDQIINTHQNDLIPLSIRLVQSFKTHASVAKLKEWQQKVGSPFVRTYSSLALYELGQKGPWKEELITWIHNEKSHPLIRLRPMIPWSKKDRKSPYEISPEEKSQLLIEAYLALASKQEEGALELLLAQLAQPNSKNKLALAGILIKATE